MRKAILLVCFGTANKGAIESSINKIEEDIRKEFDNKYLVLKAFTSKILIKILKAKENITVPRIDEALFHLSSEGYDEVIIQPLHIMSGLEYEDIKTIMKEYEYSFKSLKIGKTLLGFEGKELKIACNKVVDAISSDIPKDRNVVLVGHGSKTGSNESYYELEARFKELGYKNLLIGTLEGERNLDAIINEIKNREMEDILLMPLLILPGNHAKKDIECGEKSWAEKISHEGIKVEINMKALLEYKQIREIYIDKIKSLIG